MKKRGLCLGIVVFCLFCPAPSAQYHGRLPHGPNRKQWAQPPNQHSPTQATQSSNPRELRTEADEMAKLAQSVLSDIDAVTTHGVLSKDLLDKLERIQKLSKKLRNQIQP